MASSSNTMTSRTSRYYTDYSTRSQDVITRIDNLFQCFQEFLSTPDFVIIHELWPRFPTLPSNNFSMISPPQPCILSGADVQPKGILKEFCEAENLSWTQVEEKAAPVLLKLTHGPNSVAARDLINSKRADIDFINCLSPQCFRDQVITNCVGLVNEGPWFSSAHVEIGGGASFAYLHSGLKIWCSATSNSSSRVLERCCNNVTSFLDLIQRGPRAKEASYLRFTIQRPGDLIFIPSLRPHAVLTVHTGKPTILSGWDACPTADVSILKRLLDEYTLGVRRGTWRRILRSRGREELRNWVFSPAVGPQECKEEIQAHWTYWEKHCPQLLASLSI